MLQGRDLIAAAKTGTGKTAAFSLPSMDQLGHREGNDRGPFMLIVTPTRELASQIADTCMPIGKHTHHFVGTFVGGVAYGPQIKKLERGLDVAIVTPGRMIDLMERGAADLSQVQVLVLDEADRMLDMGFWPQVQRIVEATPENRQTLLFSATIDRSQDKTMFSILNDPAIVEIAHRGETADKVDQYVIKTTRRQKPELLNSFIKEKGGYRVIVFTRTKGGADNCCRRLRRIGIPAEAIHADRSQAQRSRALTNFREGKTNVLVATDVLARGIDVPEVDYVVNYDLPMMPEDYVHRIGRTGRAGKQGTAITFVSPSEFRGLNNLMRDIKVEIKRETLPSPQDIVEMKRLKIKEEMQEIVENESYDGYKEFAEELLAEYTPDVALGALLRLAFRSELDQNNYPEIRSFSVDRKGTARLFLAVGKRDGYTARKLVDMLKFKCGLRDKYINDVQISDNFSFVSVPFRDAEEVVRKLNRLNRGRRPMAEIARDGENGAQEAPVRKPRRTKTEDYQAAGQTYAPAPKKPTRNVKPATPVPATPTAYAPAPAHDETVHAEPSHDQTAYDPTSSPRRKLKTKPQPHPDIPDFSKMSNEGFDWSAFMKFDEGTAWGRDENGKGKGKATKSVRKPPKKTVTAAQRVAAKGKKRK